MPYTDFKSQAEWKMYFHQNVQKAVYPRVLEYLPKMGSVTSLVDLTDWAAAKPKISPPVHTWYPGQITLLLRDGKDTLYGQNWTRPSLIWMVLGQSYKTHSHSICPAIHLSPWSNWKISFDTMQMLWNWKEYRAHSHKWYCLLSP